MIEEQANHGEDFLLSSISFVVFGGKPVQGVDRGDEVIRPADRRGIPGQGITNAILGSRHASQTPLVAAEADEHRPMLGGRPERRLYVRDLRSGYQGVYFVTNAITNTLYGLAARLLAKGMPMHVLHQGTLTLDEQGTVSLLLDPGRGTAPDAKATLRLGKSFPVEGPWSTCFESYNDFLTSCVPQDRALSSQPWSRQVTRQEINLNIALEACQPLEGTVSSATAQALVGDAVPFCFYVPKVAFRFEKEVHDRYESRRAVLQRKS